jgi:hypothetical protein
VLPAACTLLALQQRDLRKPGDADGAAACACARGATCPVLPLVLYYGVLIALGLLLIRFVPGAEDAITAPITPSGDVATCSATPRPIAAAAGSAVARPVRPPGAALFAVFGAVALALPVAGIYMHTRGCSYDPSLVQTMIVLPIVVAGVVLVVKNSLALAFALAGIVAGVRFRQKLNEPKDAVYVLLSLGLGLAAAVQALDVALAVSLVFNVVVLAALALRPGHVVGGPPSPWATPLLLTAAPSRREGRALAIERKTWRRTASSSCRRRSRTRRAAPSRSSLSGVAKEWHITRPAVTRQGMHRFDAVLRLGGSGIPSSSSPSWRNAGHPDRRRREYTPFRAP